MNNEIDINLIEPELKASNVKFAGIFGSFAKGKAKDSSDIDILVKFGEPVSLLQLIHLERIISEKIGRDVDLVTEDSLSPFIKEKVLHDLKAFYGSR